MGGDYLIHATLSAFRSFAALPLPEFPWENKETAARLRPSHGPSNVSAAVYRRVLGEGGRRVLFFAERCERLLRQLGTGGCKKEVNKYLSIREVWLWLYKAHLRLAHGRDGLVGKWTNPQLVNIVAAAQEDATPSCPGVYFTGQFGADRWALQDVFCCKRPGFYADIGAAHSWKISNTYPMDTFLGWNGVCADVAFEDPEAFKHTRRCAQRQKVAVHRTSKGTLSFLRPFRDHYGEKVYGHGGLVGADGEAALLDTWSALGDEWQIENRTIQLVSLWDLLETPLQKANTTTVDFMSLDTEGQEDEILEGFFERRDAEQAAQPSAPLPTILSLAVESKPEEDAAKAKRIADLLTARGYRLDLEVEPMDLCRMAVALPARLVVK
eukprot:TRINITY_DN21390_c0_g1_i5.p1 TRINITY_DN21390_c0_g1~~TRINITY_DN21390_c0_g1_i5.p1  ORF type:complete len:382 (-),score=88.46 TRINITY_DN21390_c0_g1_i5:1199-2344(-)